LYSQKYLPGRNQNPGNCANGQLTEVGYQQQLKNGQSLKALYGKLLPPEFDPSLIYVRSTNVPRTFLSAEALLYGLYPPEEGCSDTGIVINTIDSATDNMTPNIDVCPKLVTYMEQFYDCSLWKNYFNSKVLPLEQTLAPIFNLTPGYEIDMMFDCVQANLCHNHTLPAAFTQAMYDGIVGTNLFEYIGMSQWAVAQTPYTTVQISMGSFIRDVITNIDSVASGNSKQQLALFSGHDTTVLPFVLAYNASYAGVWPPYASMIRIELLDAGSYGDQIRFYYNDVLLTIPGCSSSTCPYSTFKSISMNLAQASKFC